MDTSKYIKKCPRCGTEIELDRYTTAGDKATIMFIEIDYDQNNSLNINFLNSAVNGKRKYIPTTILTI